MKRRDFLKGFMALAAAPFLLKLKHEHDWHYVQYPYVTVCNCVTCDEKITFSIVRDESLDVVSGPGFGERLEIYQEIVAAEKRVKAATGKIDNVYFG